MLGFWKSDSSYQALAKDELDAEVASTVSPIPKDSTFNKWRRVICISVAVIVLALLALVNQEHIPRPWHSQPKCDNPPSRREWRTLDTEEKQGYINAVKCLYEKPSKLHDVGRLTDDFAWVHIRTSFDTHYKPTFLLWHRYFIWLYESALKDQCGYNGTLPYWEWALDWESPEHAPIWNSETGFGGNGVKNEETTVGGGSCVRDGPFAEYEVYYANLETDPHCLSRGFNFTGNFTGNAFAPKEVEKLYAIGELTKFSDELEEKSHDAIPNGIGGDFALFTAPSDPVWFLHHSNIDRLFWRWQMGDPKRRFRYEKLRKESKEVRTALDDPMAMLGFADELPAKDVLDPTSGSLCYTFE